MLLIQEAEKPSAILQVPRSGPRIAAQSEDRMPFTALHDLRKSVEESVELWLSPLESLDGFDGEFQEPENALIAS